MNTKIKQLRKAMGIALTTSAMVAPAAVCPFQIPAQSGTADAENSLTQPFSGWNDLTRFFKIRCEGAAETNTCVQVAIGTDVNSDGALQPEETDLILGNDCGTWFLREEGQGQRSRSTVEEIAHHSSTSTLNFNLSHTFDLSRIFNRDWNLVTVTFHNNPSATIRAEFKNNPLRIIVR